MPTDLEKHLAGKIAGLNPDARRAVYDEARAGLQSEVRAAAPFMPVKTVVARRRDLENAIIAVEKDAARSDPRRPFDAAPKKPAPLSRSLPEPAVTAQGGQSAPPPEPKVIAEHEEETPSELSEIETQTLETPETGQTAAEYVFVPVEDMEVSPETWPGESEFDEQQPETTVVAPPETAYEAPAAHFEEASAAAPAKTRRTIVPYAAVLALVICAIALAAAIAGFGLDQMQERTAPVAAAPPPVAPRPVPHLIQSAGFQTAAQDALKEGNAFLARREFDRALASFDDAIRLDPSAAAFGNRAFAHWNKGNTAAAIRDYGAAIERDPSNAINRLNRAVAYNREGEYQRAIDDLDRVLAVDPTNANALNSRCWARAVSAYLQEALSDCNEALRIRPDDPDALDSRGFVYLRLGRLDRAIADYSAALKLQPKHAGSLYGRGLAKIGRGDRAGGNEDVTAARALDPEIVAAFARYGIR